MQVKKVVRPWRSEGPELAFVRFETAAREQAQMERGPLPQLERQTAVRFCVDAGLVADALRGVHGTAGRGDAVELYGACLSVFRRCDGDRADRQHEDGGGGADQWSAALPSEAVGLRQLLRRRAAGLPSLPATDQGQDRIDDSLYQVELLAGTGLRLADGVESAGTGSVRRGRSKDA